MSTQDPGRAQPAPLTSLPRIEDVPFTDHGYDPDQIRSAFEAFQRHVAQLQAQLRVLQAAGRSSMEPSGHAVRMDALHLIRSAAEFADALERDAQTASTTQLSRTEEEIRTRQQEMAARAVEIERFRQESERQRQEILGVARNESRELLANAQRESSQELREAESRGNKLLEQARHQATELTNAARAEVEGTLEWARAHSSVPSTSARAALVSSVAWCRACSSSLLPRDSASRSSCEDSRWALASSSRDSLRATPRISWRWRSDSWRKRSISTARAAISCWRVLISSSVRESCVVDAVWASRSSASANSAAERIRSAHPCEPHDRWAPCSSDPPP